MVFNHYLCISVADRPKPLRLNVDPQVLAQTQSMDGENAQQCAILIQTWIALSSDIARLHDYKLRARDLLRFRRVLMDDLVAFIRESCEIADLMNESFQMDGSLIDLSSDSTVRIHKFLSKTPIARLWIKLCGSQDASLYREILTFLYFGKKLEIKDHTLEPKALRSWQEVEDRLLKMSLNPYLVSRLRSVMEYLLADSLDPDWPYMAKHGPGQTAEGISDQAKKTVHLKRLPNQENLMALVNYESDQMPWDYDLFQEDLLPSWRKVEDDMQSIRAIDVSRDSSKLRFVPKTYKSMRSICMEPVSFQFAQQGIGWALLRLFARHPLLGRSIHLDDQTYNQYAARFGSNTGLVDTIDLSAASDSVSWDLLKQVIPEHILPYLEYTRTCVVELPDGSLHNMTKYAPMGSALCMPVQTLLYSSIVLLGMLMHYEDVSSGIYYTTSADVGEFCDTQISRGFSRKIGRTLKYQPLIVYGDDIICDAKATPYVVSLLQLFGFQVNTTKSFKGRQAFRESCGRFYLAGEDVTPCLYRVRWHSHWHTTDSLLSAISTANNLGDYGYHEAQRVLSRYVRFHPPVWAKKLAYNPIFFTSDPDKAGAALYVLPGEVRNSHLRSREDEDLQRTEWKGWVVKAEEVRKVTPSDPAFEVYSVYTLSQYWRSVRVRNDELCDRLYLGRPVKTGSLLKKSLFESIDLNELGCSRFGLISTGAHLTWKYAAYF